MIEKAIRLKAEYAFEGEANIDPELRNVMEKLQQVPYKNSYFNISSIPKPRPVAMLQKEAPVNSETHNNADPIADTKPTLPDKPVGSITILTNTAENDLAMKRLVAAITKKNFDSVQSFFTGEGFSVFQKLLQYGNAQIVKSFDLKYYQYGDYVICRSIPMSFQFLKQTTEHLLRM